MGKELSTVDRYDRMNSIVEDYHKGINLTAIAKKMRMSRKDVQEYIDEWRSIARNDKQVQSRAQEALYSMDTHYQTIIRELWSAADDAGSNGDIRTRASILRSLADIEAKRVGMLQQAGLLDNVKLGDDVARVEERQEALVKILREVSYQCPNCRAEVSSRLSKIMNKPEVIVPE